jgi:3-oxoacyl-(acyl-carrier-protein) synthase
VVDEAIADARADLFRGSERLGVVVGLSKGWIEGLSQLSDRLGPPGKPVPLATSSAPPPPWHGCWPGGGAARISATVPALGPALAPIAACATGLVTVLQGAELIRSGVCDAVLAGAVDASLHPLILGAFERLGVLARVDPEDPGGAIRPWDRTRSGFLPAEGGAIFVLERAGLRARSAPAYAEIRGGALGADAYHITGLDPDPAPLARLIRRALASTSTEPAEVGHINVHATATEVNDPLECQAIRQALGQEADRVICTASKPQIGHLLGAAGAVELAICCLSLRDQILPPLLNLRAPDLGCDLRSSPVALRDVRFSTALKLSLGFGGHLAAVVLHREPEAIQTTSVRTI